MAVKVYVGLCVCVFWWCGTVSGVEYCERYDRQQCNSTTGEGCTPVTTQCQPSEGCMAYFYNNTSDGFEIVLKDCWYHENSSPCHGDQCVAQPPFTRADKPLFCCCVKDMCNTHVYDLRTNIDIMDNSSLEEMTSLTTPSQEQGCSDLVLIIVPIASFCVICCVVIFLIKRYKRHRQRQRIPTYEVHPPDSVSLSSLDSVKNSLEEINLCVVKGRGRFGCVWQGTMDTKAVAVKIFKADQRKVWSNEVQIFRSLHRHPQILRYLGLRQNDNEFWLVTEYHSFGSLYDYLQNHHINWDELLTLAISMCQGLAYLHHSIPPGNNRLEKPSIAHRDFKSQNVLVKADLTACVADFGLALSLTSESYAGEDIEQVGTRRYMAPELLELCISFNKEFFLRIDMYACSFVLWELLSRCTVFNESVEAYKAPLEAELGTTPTPQELSKAVVDRQLRPAIQDKWRENESTALLVTTIEESWDPDPEARLTAGMVVERLSELIADNSPIKTSPDSPPVILNNHTPVTKIDSESDFEHLLPLNHDLVHNNLATPIANHINE